MFVLVVASTLRVGCFVGASWLGIDCWLGHAWLTEQHVSVCAVCGSLLTVCCVSMMTFVPAAAAAAASSIIILFLFLCRIKTATGTC